VIRQYDKPFFDHVLASEGGFDAAIHGIMELAGLTKRFRRPPYHTLTDQQMDRLAAFCKEKGIL